MKKLSLKNLNLGVDHMLQRNELKTVFGGYNGNGTCDLEDDNACSTNSDCSGEDKCTTFNCKNDDGTAGTYKSCI